MDKMSDQEIMESLRSNQPKVQEKAFSYLYGLLFSKTVSFIRKNNGTKEDARDIYQDSLLAFYKLVRQDRLPADTKAEAYIFSIFRNLWFKKIQKDKREEPFEPEQHDLPISPQQLEQLIASEQHELLDSAIAALGPDCQAILVAFYYEQLRMDEICKTLGYSNTQVAKNKKYNCMKKLKKLVFESEYFRQLLK